LYNESTTLSPKRVKDDCAVFTKMWRLSLFWKHIFWFSHAESFGYDVSPNDGTVTFLGQIWGNFPISIKTGDELMNPITGY